MAYSVTPKRQVGGSNPLSDAVRNAGNTGVPEFSAFLLSEFANQNSGSANFFKSFSKNPAN